MLSKIAFIGGDLRMLEAARFAHSKCNVLSVYGFDKYDYCYECFDLTLEKTIESSVFGAEAVVLGLPCTINEKTLFAPYSSREMTPSELFSQLSFGTKVFCGKASPAILNAARENNLQCYDYFDREELTIKNALITAEGAIQTAMLETPYTLHGSKCLVIGYGRIGKLLSSLLSRLNADVTCTARKTADLALIECNGLNAAVTENIASIVADFDIIFNTVPFCVLPESILCFVRSDTVVIDLASKPGGVDFNGAKKYGLKVIWATALPGKVAPETSGKIISETIFNILSEQSRR